MHLSVLLICLVGAIALITVLIAAVVEARNA
jgi:hypothetical protein